MNTAVKRNSKNTKNHPVVLNGYRIVDLEALRWKSAIYEIKSTAPVSKSSRATVKDVMWNFKKAHRSQCPGFGFVVEMDETSVAVPAEWPIPSGAEWEGYTFKRREEIEANGADLRHSTLFARIIKDALRSHLKKVGPATLGPLWQDYSTLCQIPTEKTANGFAFCRRFDFDPKPLANGRWALRFMASTASVDAFSIGQYYAEGRVEELADFIHAKLNQRTNRRGRPVKVRVLYGTKHNGERNARVLDMFAPEQILDDAKLPVLEQKERANLPLQCQDFVDGAVAVAKGNCYLILDSQITQDDHEETILEPEERGDWAKRLRDLSNGCEIFGKKLLLANAPLSDADFQNIHILPPPVHVRDSFGLTVLEAPANATANELRDRAKARDNHVRRFGFYEHRPIAPLLAIPASMDKCDGETLRALLNQLLKERNIAFQFPAAFSYRDATAVNREIEHGRHDALLCVLPEGRNQPYHNHNTHELVKQRVSVPSQCICHDNAFPKPIRGMSFEQALRRDQRLSRRMKNQLELCLLNLLVKAQWFPFIPAQAANYNVHIGLDVGGKLNTTVVASIGYGFENPNGGFLFKPVEIEMNPQGSEPVPPDALFHGLLRLIEETREALELTGDEPNFDRVLIMRDGQLLGDGEEWNEMEALTRLFEHCLAKGWINPSATWTTIEIMKAGDGWRILQNNGKLENPVVGYCCFPFPSANEGLLCTTGQPYLSQGTAMPLKFRIQDIAGIADREKVVCDLVWEADMCFTKLDMGQSLPWTLHIADSGALQLSRSYRISGIPV